MDRALTAAGAIVAEAARRLGVRYAAVALVADGSDMALAKPLVKALAISDAAVGAMQDEGMSESKIGRTLSLAPRTVCRRLAHVWADSAAKDMARIGPLPWGAATPVRNAITHRHAQFNE